MIHPHVSLRFVNDHVGFGLFASARLLAGTITWCLDPLDLRLDPAEVKALGPLYRANLDRYAWPDSAGRLIYCWDIGRFMNHSCRANSMSPGFDFEIAVRDIEAGEEIVCDYGALNLDEHFDCACGEPRCRGRVRPGDFETYADAWDAQLRVALPSLLAVEQPLLPLVDADVRARLARIVAGADPMPSVRAHRYIAPKAPRVLPEASRPAQR